MKHLLHYFPNHPREEECYIRLAGYREEEEIDELEEAGALNDISHMPARVKCAVLGWRTRKEAIGGEEE